VSYEHFSYGIDVNYIITVYEYKIDGRGQRGYARRNRVRVTPGEGLARSSRQRPDSDTGIAVLAVGDLQI
jgi:hypothetical protein